MIRSFIPSPNGSTCATVIMSGMDTDGRLCAHEEKIDDLALVQSLRNETAALQKERGPI